MTDQVCAMADCKRPPVQGSKYCEYHLAEQTRKTRNIIGALGVVAIAIVGVVWKIMSGKKS